MLSADPKKFLLLTQQHYGSTVTASLFKDTHQFYWFQWRKMNDLSSLFLTASLLIKEAFPHCFGARLQPAPLLHSGWPLNPWLRWPFTEKSPLMWSAEKPHSRRLWLRHSKQIVLLSALDAAVLTSRTGMVRINQNCLFYNQAFYIVNMNALWLSHWSIHVCTLYDHDDLMTMSYLTLNSKFLNST